MADAQPAAKSVIETDTFCQYCGFNLMTQPVWLDERLEILVCRCPECGRHHPAQGKSTIGTAWLHRLGTLGLVAWVVAMMGVAAAVYLGSFGMDAAGMGILTRSSQETMSGQPVVQTWDGTSKTVYVLVEDANSTSRPFPASKIIAPANVREVTRLVSWLPGGKEDPAFQYGPDMLQAMFILSIFAFGLFLCGGFLASACWFWPKGKKWAWLALPALALATMELVNSQPSRGMRPQPSDAIPHYVFASMFAIQVIAIGAGLLLGRAMSRIALLMFVPPRARQVFAFLWLCDGKTPPSAKGTATPP